MQIFSRMKVAVYLNSPPLTGWIFTLLLLVRNFWLYWNYSYAFSPDSNLYVHQGASFFKTWYISPLVTFPYPFLNAIAQSSRDPALLIWLQMLLSAAAGGFFVYGIARKNVRFGWLVGGLLMFDLVWGALARSILTDGLFAMSNLLAVGLLLFQYDRRERLSGLELALAGVVYALSMSIRPSNIFLVAIIPPVYLWLTRSWKKVIYLTVGFLVFFAIMGLINLRGSQKFYILSGSGSYTNDYLAFPLFLYRLYLPENGPASEKIDQYLQTCFPGEELANSVNRLEEGTLSDLHNRDLLYHKIIPCVKSQAEADQDPTNFFAAAYVEALVSHPAKFAQAILREVAIFIRYGNPYYLRWLLNPDNNYGCTDLVYCDQIEKSRSQWDQHNLAVGLYEKLATKVLQVYMLPIRFLATFLPEKRFLPYLVSWAACILLAVLFTRGYERVLAIASNLIIAYTAVIVVAGLGFNERYASMLSPMQTVFSGLIWMLILRVGIDLWRRLPPRRRAAAKNSSA